MIRKLRQLVPSVDVLVHAARAKKQLRGYADSLRDLGSAPRVANDSLALALAVRGSARRALSSSRPHVVAFGAHDWEDAGLWPAFERDTAFGLFDYGQLARGKASTDALRSTLARRFLDFIDSRESEIGPVQFAYFYAAGAFLDPELLRTLSSRGIWTALMGLDDKHQIMRPGALQLGAARLVDVYWTTWRAAVPWLFSRGVTAWYAPEAADPNVFRPPAVANDRDIDVLWVGRRYGARERLVSFLRRCGIRVEAYGPGWPSGLVSLERMVELYGRAKVVLGASGVMHTDRIKHLKGRDFEVPMAGALYLTGHNAELADFFDIGREVFTYSSPEECAETILWLKHNPDVAARTRVAARVRALRDHTWQSRLAALFQLFRGGSHA